MAPRVTGAAVSALADAVMPACGGADFGNRLDGQRTWLMHEEVPHALENVLAHRLVPEEDPDARQRGEVGFD